jgi:hypothetical protein
VIPKIEIWRPECTKGFAVRATFEDGWTAEAFALEARHLYPRLARVVRDGSQQRWNRWKAISAVFPAALEEAFGRKG